jgi:hypothetical protein
MQIVVKEKQSMTAQSSNSFDHQEIKLIVSEDEAPAVTLKPGMRLEVKSVPLVNPTLEKAQAIGATLCGGTSTCIAIIEISQPARDIDSSPVKGEMRQ